MAVRLAEKKDGLGVEEGGGGLCLISEGKFFL